MDKGTAEVQMVAKLHKTYIASLYNIYITALLYVKYSLFYPFDDNSFHLPLSIIHF